MTEPIVREAGSRIPCSWCGVDRWPDELNKKGICIFPLRCTRARERKVRVRNKFGFEFGSPLQKQAERDRIADRDSNAISPRSHHKKKT